MCLNELPLSIFTVMGIVSAISVAELIVGPVVYSFASEVAAKGRGGAVMGMLPIAFSLSYLLSGKFSKWMAVSEGHTSLFIYGSGFGKIALAVIAGGIILEILMKRYGNAKRALS